VSLPVTTTPEADAQVGTIDEWWRENRSSAPDLFLDELTVCFDVIGHTPHIGRVYRQSPVPGTRRILLKSSRYHVYYVPGPAEVTVLAVWHAQRGVGPPLRMG
jgi:plasmid stabilization system protein ParE